MIDDRDQRSSSSMVNLTKGDDDAMNDIMSDWAGPLIGYLTKHTGCRSVAEDLAQQTFVRVYRNKWEYRPHLKFSTWLFTIASNLAKNYHRWKHRHPEDSMDPEKFAELISSERDDPEQAAKRSETMNALELAIQELPEVMREALLLSTSQGLSHREIARIHQTTEKAVELRIYRARQILREQMAPYFDRSDDSSS
jgi:RNA polymerase sigma-70 factor (ECF subfamily)